MNIWKIQLKNLYHILICNQYWHTFLYQKLSTGVGELGAVLADALKHAEVVKRHEQDDATNLYPQQMEQIVLEVHPSQQNATLRHAVSFNPYLNRNKCNEFIYLLSIFSNVIVYHVFPIACGVDRYPRNMPCRNAYSCHKLATRKGCNKKFTQVLPTWCWQKLSNWDRRQLVKSFCRKSCKNCLGKD